MKTSIKKIQTLISFCIIVIVAIIPLLVLMLKTEKPTKLVFSETKESSFELLRIGVEGKKIVLTSAGALEVNGDNVIPQIEKPLFPWESSNEMEYTNQIWGALPLLLKGLSEKNQIPLGIIEYFNHYYLVTENEKQQYLYPLSSSNPINAAIKTEKFFGAINRYHTNKASKLTSGGNGLLY